MNKEQGFLLLVLAIAALASLAILLPLLQFVLLAVIFAYVLRPLNVRLEPYLGWRFSPMAVITGAVVAVVLPLVYIGVVLYRDLARLAAANPGIDVAVIEGWVLRTTGQAVDVSGLFGVLGTDLLRVLFGDVTDLVSMVAFVAIGLTLVVFLVYYLLRDGEAFVAWLIELAPVNDRVATRLVDQIDRTTHGVIAGHLFVALAQGVVGGIAFWIVGIPNVIFWTFVMALLALLPVIGPFLVWAPVAGYLLLIGEIPEATFLALWGAIVISLIDNYARPIIIDRDAHLNPAVILVGVFGGIYAIGVTGLFIGPIVLGVLVAAMQVFNEEWDRLGSAP